MSVPEDELISALADVSRAQEETRSHMPGGSLGSFPLPAELRALRRLADAVRAYPAGGPAVHCKCCVDNECECEGRKTGPVTRTGEIIIITDPEPETWVQHYDPQTGRPVTEGKG